MKIAVLQKSALGMSSNLENYVKVCHSYGVEVLLLGEYLLNRFFKELENTPLSMVKEQSEFHLQNLKALSKKYGVHIVAPMILVKAKQPYKTIVKFSPSRTSYYYQQVLMNYPHWDEEKFFANDVTELSAPPTFKVGNIKLAYMAGFELHFDYFWMECLKKGVDVVLLPTSSTFESNKRWQEIIKSRALLNHMYVVRANRVGVHKEKEYDWHFYGDSFSVNPFGEVEQALQDQEELMITKVDKEIIKEARKLWKFSDALHKRKIL